MSAQLSDLFRKLGGASSLVNTARVTSTRAAAGATLAVDNCNWDQTTAKYFATYQVNTSGAVVAGTEIIWNGIVTGTTSIGSLTRIAGASDTGNAIGDYVQLLPSSAWANALIQGILVQHNQDGTHGAVTATSVSAATGTFTGDVSDNGVTLKTIRNENTANYVASGCVITGTGVGTTLGWSMTSGVVYIGGKRLTVASATGTVTASKDTYFDVLDPGTGTVGTLVNTAGNIVANNAASPALAASSVRIGIVVSAATIAATTSIAQGGFANIAPVISSQVLKGFDSLGNLVYPKGPVSTGLTQIPYKFSIYRNAAWTTPTGSGTAVAFDTKEYDTGNNCSIVTGLFTAPVAGFYKFSTTVGNSGSTTRMILSLMKNGSEFKRLADTGTIGSTAVNLTGSDTLQLAAGDTVGVLFQTPGGAVAGGTGLLLARLAGELVSVS